MDSIFKPDLFIKIYATTIKITAKQNIILKITGFLIFIFSFFLDAFNKSISLYLDIITVLNIMTSKNIIPKYKIVFKTASIEKAN